MSETIRILDTGTTPTDSIPEGTDVVHRPALVRRALPLDTDEIRVLLRQPHQIIFYSRFAVGVIAKNRVIEHADDHYFWAVGGCTAASATELFNVETEFPEDEQFTGLIKTLLSRGTPRPIIAFGLAGTDRDLSPVARDWDVGFTTIPVYESRASDAVKLVEAFEEHQPDWLTVTSSRGARAVADAIGIEKLRQLKIAAIGPSTASTLSELGLSADIIPTRPDRFELLRLIAES